MIGSDCFIDTNILFYAFDRDAGTKRDAALERLAEFGRLANPPFISVQVLNELYTSLTRPGRLKPKDAKAVVESLMDWRVVSLSSQTVRQAFAEVDRWQVSWWDALILATARQAGAKELWSEDFNEGQDYGGILVVNPLRQRKK